MFSFFGVGDEMRLTKRDVEIIKFINDFGYCEMPQIMERFSLKRTWMYEIVGRLIEEKLVGHKYLLHWQRIYFVTHKGARYTDLPPVSRIPVGQYEHQMHVINIYNKLIKKYPDAHWISERKIKHDLFCDGLGKTGHISDGILLFPDGKQVAIEVELSTKGKNRIEKILRKYITQLTIKEVWYFCFPQVIPVLTELSKKIPFIKIHNLTEYLHNE